MADDTGQEQQVPGLPEEWEVAPEPGWVDRTLAEEFPGLSIMTTTLSVGAGRSPEALKERLRLLSDRFGGAQAIQLRQQAIPWAYRVFFRHIGLDPDQQPTPIEQISLDRMRGGRFKSENRVDDALTIAMVEVGVSLQAFDADRVEGRLGLRLSAEEEGFEGRVSPLPEGTIVIADEKRPLAILFGKKAEGRGVKSKTTRTMLAAIGVRGVPEVALEEGLWVAASAMHA
jgi:DNA/RNA-binding domain of Phe-tRNA-synthetase-like protein